MSSLDRNGPKLVGYDKTFGSVVRNTTASCYPIYYDWQSTESDLVGYSKASSFIRVMHLLTKLINELPRKDESC